jgi:hypothetical protein
MYPISTEAKGKELNIIKNTLHNNKYNMNKIIKSPALQKQNTDMTGMLKLTTTPNLLIDM